MRVEVYGVQQIPEVCAERIASDLRAATGERGCAVLALSGGSTPIPMFAQLAAHDVPWDRVDVVQVDERVAPDGDPARNIEAIRSAFVDQGPLPAENLHPMDVTAPDLDAAAGAYSDLLDRLAHGIDGGPPVLDVVQLGMGPDGHTASLVPGDAVLDVFDRWVAVTEPYQGHRRLTLTYPVLDAARRVVWLVEGGDKAEQVLRLDEGDAAIPAGRVEASNALIVCDPAAASWVTR
jgi:6-phosphogluconolactonase